MQRLSESSLKPSSHPKRFEEQLIQHEERLNQLSIVLRGLQKQRVVAELRAARLLRAQAIGRRALGSSIEWLRGLQTRDCSNGIASALAKIQCAVLSSESWTPNPLMRPVHLSEAAVTPIAPTSEHAAALLGPQKYATTPADVAAASAAAESVVIASTGIIPSGVADHIAPPLHPVAAAHLTRHVRLPPRRVSVPAIAELEHGDVQAKQAIRHEAFLAAVHTHVRDFKEFHRTKRAQSQKLLRSIRQAVAEKERVANKEAAKEERERLKALRTNDMAAYAQLVDKAKNQRLQFLINQTDEYLSNLGVLVQSQQQENKKHGRGQAGPGAAAGAAESDDDDDDEEEEEEDEDMDGVAGETAEGDEAAAEALAAKRRAKAEQDAHDKYYLIAHKRRERIRQPAMLVGGTLKAYQVEGLEWLVSLYNNNLNGILADEMGLGKTVQAISLLCYLMEVKQNNGPFLVVVPLSTLSNWASEFQRWAPDITVIEYKGTPAQRKRLHQYEISSGKYNVLLTTYEYVMRDKRALRQTQWQYIIIDEGHRMKNANSKFASVLSEHYQSRNRLLLTGTPLQNNLPELWALLNFLLPKIFNSVENFETWFNRPFSGFGGSAEEQQLSHEETLLVINRLHQVLRPFLLRRVKRHVLDQLPEKVEKIVRCDMSAWQKIVYRQIRKYGHIMGGEGQGQTAASAQKLANGAGSTRALSNTIMQLRKICNHPYVFLEQGYMLNEDIVRASGKFRMLDQMLPKLKAGGHRVLIFSQFTSVMDILGDYLKYRNYKHLRLDGSTLADDRAQRMHIFNAPDSPYFIFLLSTRAGGLGVNLATADTVIIFDSDWNPSMDLQAQDRAHRIGQTREVQIFRFATNTVVENKILSAASQKMSMNDLVIEAGDFNHKSKVDPEKRKAMLQQLLEMDNEDVEEDQVPGDEQVNDMMARDEEELALYQSIDAKREARLQDQPGGFKSPLMLREDVPAWLLESDKQLERAAAIAAAAESGLGLGLDGSDGQLGRGARERRDVQYGDKLSERQWVKMIEKGENPAGEEEDEEEEAEGGGYGGSTERNLHRLTVASTSEGRGRGRGRGRRGRPKKVEVKLLSKAWGRGKHQPGSEVDSRALSQHPEAIASREKVCRSLRPLFKKLRYMPHPTTGALVSELFLERPDRNMYPGYYTTIKHPIALDTIESNLTANRYSSIDEFDLDLTLMFRNCYTFNPVMNYAVESAHLLERTLRLELMRLRGETVPMEVLQEVEPETAARLKAAQSPASTAITTPSAKTGAGARGTKSTTSKRRKAPAKRPPAKRQKRRASSGGSSVVDDDDDDFEGETDGSAVASVASGGRRNNTAKGMRRVSVKLKGRGSPDTTKPAPTRARITIKFGGRPQAPAVVADDDSSMDDA